MNSLAYTRIANAVLMACSAVVRAMVEMMLEVVSWCHMVGPKGQKIFSLKRFQMTTEIEDARVGVVGTF